MTDAGANEQKPLDVDERFIRDREGRALILRGFNVAHTAKRSPDGLPWTTREDILRIRRDFGLNSIRLTLFWRFIEPTKGSYDLTYLSKIRTLLDHAHEADIWVLLDMHQDLFGYEATDSAEGDGPPEWARDPSCPPFADLSPWNANYLSGAVPCQFEAFYANKNGVLDAFEAMWKVTAKELADHPAVVGIDLFNEPWVVSTPEKDLSPFYDRMIPAVRAVAPDALVFYEPGTLSGSYADQSIPKPKFPRLVYAPHFYPPLPAGEDAYVHDPMPLKELYERHTEDGDAAKVPLFIGEFGGGGGRDNISEMYVYLLDLWRPDFVGFSRWAYDSAKTYDFAVLDAEGAAFPDLVAMLEPYAERIPGNPESTQIDREGRVLSVTTQMAEEGDLVISCPSRFCAKEPTISVRSDGSSHTPKPVKWDEENGQIEVRLPKGDEVLFELRY